MFVMDALSSILKMIQLSVNTYFFRGVGRWNMQIKYRPEGLFYVVLKGQCCFREEGSEDLQPLKEGDIIALPTGGNHWICDSPTGLNLTAENVTRVGRDDDLLILKTGRIEAFPTGYDYRLSTSRPDQSLMPKGLEVEVSGNESVPPDDLTMAETNSEKSTALLVGTMSYDTSVDHPFLKDLPCFVHTSTQNNWLESFVGVLEKESAVLSPGSTLMVDRLTEILTIQLLRAHMQQMKHSDGYMAALSDPRIGRVLNLIHAETDAKLTVDSLSKTVALNRTSFQEKFVAMVGSTPKAYLTNMRMQKAKSSLQHSNDSIPKQLSVKRLRNISAGPRGRFDEGKRVRNY
jgi:AraC-like DNA-binding protein